MQASPAQVAAAGSHHTLLVDGDMAVAERLYQLLPDDTDRPPFVGVHHGSSIADMADAMTQAHRGVLYLDDAPKFRSQVLASLCRPMDWGTLVVARGLDRTRQLCNFQLVMAAESGTVRNLPRTLLDRIDVRVPVQQGVFEDASVVMEARARAAQRWIHMNGETPGAVLRSSRFRLDPEITVDLDANVKVGLVSLRGYDRCVRVAWTLADLAGRPVPTRDDVQHAMALRAGP